MLKKSFLSEYKIKETNQRNVIEYANKKCEDGEAYYIFMEHMSRYVHFLV